MIYAIENIGVAFSQGEPGKLNSESCTVHCNDDLDKFYPFKYRANSKLFCSGSHEANVGFRPRDRPTA